MIKIFYRLKRQGSLAVVFLHGFGGDLTVWQFMEKSILKKGLSFLSIDLRGHGFSSRITKPLSIKVFADDIKEVLEKEGFRKAILVGHCFGGMVSLEFALRFPFILEKMILICSYYCFPWWSKPISFLSPLIKRIKIGPQLAHRDFSQFKDTGDFDFKRLFYDVKYIGSSSYFNIYQGIKSWSRKRDLFKIKTSTLVIGGRKDKIFPPNYEKRLASFLPKASLSFLNTNHVAPVNNPKGVKRLILSYI